METHIVRHLISINDLSDEDIRALVASTNRLINNKGVPSEILRGRVIATYFRKTSTRTRTAFTVASLRLGAQVVSYGPNDLQENTGEVVKDTREVLSSMLDGFVARTAGDARELRTLAEQNSMAVINAMSSDEHPTQAISDLGTILSRRGFVDGLKILYLGEGNNTALSLAYALSRFNGILLDLRTPSGYGIKKELMQEIDSAAHAHGSTIVQRHDLEELPHEVDIVYTTRWQTTGTTKTDPKWRNAFMPFQVNGALMSRYPLAQFMHDLPAHRGDEVTADVLDAPYSIAFEQAANKLASAMAVLPWSLGA